MREIRQSGSEGGGTEVNPFSLPLLKLRRHLLQSAIDNRQFLTVKCRGPQNRGFALRG